MMFRCLGLAAVAAVWLHPASARADLVVPGRAMCVGKKVGDPCAVGTCQSAGFDCLPGACRQYGSEAECTGHKDCSWREELSCTPRGPPSVEAPLTPTASPTAPSGVPSTAPQAGGPGGPGSCAQTPATLAVALVTLASFRRRRRR